MKPRVIVTRKWPAAVEQVLAERFDTTLNAGDIPFTATQLKAALLNFDAVLPTVSDRLPAEVFPRSSRAPGSSAISASASAISTSRRRNGVASS